MIQPDVQARFATSFKQLTGHSPFPWQRRLFEEFVAGAFWSACSLPTGVGKTSVIAVWLLALAEAPHKVPRRLVYAVNRRTVVDQTTAEVERYRSALEGLPDLKGALLELCAVRESADGQPLVPLAISTLRGQFADNQEWSADPARPAVICGTVDMIGSRLLFSGYRIGFRSRPHHAGLLGHDALLIHDEAHLEPAFQNLLDAIAFEQRHGRTQDFSPERRLRLMELTATSRPSRRSVSAESRRRGDQSFNSG
ncbi:MAG: type I-U CRISPR-associated helicase/endonuclease Cas3 [Planctomycetaceae bacterium]